MRPIRPLFPFLAPVGVGALLRLWNLRDQVLGGDELHGVRAALRMPLGRILVSFGSSDPCIPLAAFDRLLLDLGFPLTELLVRLPAVAAGLAALVLLPWAVSHRLARREVVLFAWLVALSPLLVLYGRTARPYMPVALLGLVALGAFDRWWQGGGARWAILYAAAAPLAIWFHLLAAPFVLAPFLFAGGDWILRRRRESRRGRCPAPGLGSLLGLALAVALVLAAALLPARESLLGVAGDKVGAQTVSARAVRGTLVLQAGTAQPVVTLLFWAAALGGFAVLLRRERAFALCGLLAAAVQLGAVVLLSPVGVEHPLILNRYLLLLSPLVLAGVAAGLAVLARPGWGRVGRAVPVVFLLVLAASGPLVRPAYRSSSFTQHNDFVLFERPLAEVPRGALSDFYRQPPAPGDLVEYPWPSIWRFGRSFYADQRVHRRRVLVSSPERVLADPRLALRNHVPPKPGAFLGSGARYLVVHRYLAAEERRLVGADGRIRGFPRGRAGRWRRASRRLARDLKAAWGPPLYRDGAILVWDLEAVRRGAPPPRR